LFSIAALVIVLERLCSEFLFSSLFLLFLWLKTNDDECDDFCAPLLLAANEADVLLHKPLLCAEDNMLIAAAAPVYSSFLTLNIYILRNNNNNMLRFNDDVDM
jgi:hypothetical protein